MSAVAQRSWPPMVVVAVLAAVAGAGYAAVFPSWSFVWVPVLGAVTGAAASYLGARRRLLVGETLTIAVVLLVVVGAVAVGGARPSGAAAFVRGLVTGWAELLTSFTPVRPTPGLLALPFVTAWFGALVGGELRRVSRVPGLAALGPLLAFAASLLFTVEDRRLALAQGVVMAAGTLVLVLLEQREHRDLEEELTTGSTGRWSVRGLLNAAGVLGVVVLLAPALGPSLPLADANERFDLRQFLVPPFDPLAVPSPLTTIKGELKEDRREEVVFVVRAADRPIRWPVAVLGAYDGVVWTVAESLTEEAGRYPPVDETIPGPPAGDLDLDVDAVHAEVTVHGLTGHWVPRPGWITELGMPTDLDVRFNPVTGNLALPDRLSEGLTYRIAAVPVPEAAALANVPLTGGGASFANLPPGIRNLVADIVQGEDGGWPQVNAIAQRFVGAGFYDVSDGARPGHSFFRLGEFLGDPERLVGFEEQYAAAAGVAVRTLEQPARVVVGYLVPPERWEADTAEVYRQDISAWIEVRTAEGWASLDVTPDRSREPEAEEQGRTVEDVAIPNPPPPPPPPPDLDPTEREDLEDPDLDLDEEDEEEPDTILAAVPPLVLYVAGGASLPVALLGLLALLVASLRARRRRRRRSAEVPAVRAAGAWQEVLDVCRELGRTPLQVDTTREAIWRLASGSSVDRAWLTALADRIDRAVLHPLPPSADDVEVVWHDAEVLAATLCAEAGLRQRLRLRLDPRGVLRRDPLREVLT